MWKQKRDLRTHDRKTTTLEIHSKVIGTYKSSPRKVVITLAVPRPIVVQRNVRRYGVNFGCQRDAAVCCPPTSPAESRAESLDEVPVVIPLRRGWEGIEFDPLIARVSPATWFRIIYIHQVTAYRYTDAAAGVQIGHITTLYEYL